MLWNYWQKNVKWNTPIMQQNAGYTQTKTSWVYGSFTINSGEGSGPSGVGVDGWQRILNSRQFWNSSSDFRKTLHRRTTILTVPRNFCRYPGLIPNGVGEILRRMAGKTVCPITDTYLISFMQLHQLHLLLVGETCFIVRVRLIATGAYALSILNTTKEISAWVYQSKWNEC